MLTITIMGPNDRYTALLEQHTRTALRWINPQDEVRLRRLSAPTDIIAYTEDAPALAINGKVMCEGRIPPSSEIVTWLSEVLQERLKAALAASVEPVTAFSTYRN